VAVTASAPTSAAFTEAEPETAGAGRHHAAEGGAGSGREALAGWERRTEVALGFVGRLVVAGTVEAEATEALLAAEAVLGTVGTAVASTSAVPTVFVAVLVCVCVCVFAEPAPGVAERGPQVVVILGIEWVTHDCLRSLSYQTSVV
jgi:hypothetical protein